MWQNLGGERSKVKVWSRFQGYAWGLFGLSVATAFLLSRLVKYSKEGKVGDSYQTYDKDNNNSLQNKNNSS